MRRRPTALKQPSCTQKKGANAHGGYVLCLPALAANEVDRLDIGDGVLGPSTTRHANQVERWVKLPFRVKEWPSFACVQYVLTKGRSPSRAGGRPVAWLLVADRLARRAGN